MHTSGFAQVWICGLYFCAYDILSLRLCSLLLHSFRAELLFQVILFLCGISDLKCFYFNKHCRNFTERSALVAGL